MVLTAQEVLHTQVQRVTAATPVPVLAKRSTMLFAVFDGNVDDGRFLGLLSASDIAPFAGQPFAELLPDLPLVTTGPEIVAEELLQRMDQGELTAVPILDAAGRFIGAVTRSSLLAVILDRERACLEQALQFQQLLSDNRERLVQWSGRIEQLQVASSRLLKLLPQRVPDDLLQYAIEALTRLIGARYGAIGLLAPDGTLKQFIHTGIDPEQAARIGDPPRGHGLLGVVISQNAPLRIDAISADPRAAGFPPHHPPMTTLLAAPVSFHGRCYGRIYLCDKHEQQAFCADDEQLVMNFANMLALMLANMDLLNERERAYTSLQESEARFRMVAEHALMGLWIYQDEVFEYVNPKLAQIFGYQPDELISRLGPLDLTHPEDRPHVAAMLHQRLEEGTVATEHCQLRGVRKDGALIRCEALGGRIEYRGRPALIGTLLDVSERHATEQQARKLSNAIEQTADIVTITDHEGIIEYVNPAFEAVTGFTREETVGRRTNLLKSGFQNREFYRRLWDTITRGDAFMEVFTNRKKNGALFYEEKTITPMKDRAGNITHYIATGKDITAQIQTQERIQYIAYHDVLTGLPNRYLLQERLGHALAQGHRNHQTLAVMLLDLDRFKHVNDSLGHPAGDELLKAVGQRLSNGIRDGDTVARLGGDEFVIVLERLSQPEDAGLIAEQVMKALAPPFHIGAADEIFVTASSGITVYPMDGDSLDLLLKNADNAMYSAKASGGNTYRYFTTDMTQRASDRMDMERCLRHALERQEFVLHYQPRINLHTGQITGTEALLRWRHPDQGEMPPAKFVPLLEETGMINEIGEWALHTACACTKAWQADLLPQLRVAVNLSAVQFRDRDLVRRIERVLDNTGLAPQYLELEITEGLLLDNLPSVTGMLNDLHAMGIWIAVDDFGTGYCSMGYLRRLPVNILKIDQTFAQDVTTDPDDAAIVEAIIAMSRSLRLVVTAEGIETEEQRAFFQAHQCDEIQGYLSGRPMPAEELLHWLREHLVA